MRILTALLIAVIGFGIAVFGIVLGLSASGPARGIRHIVTIDPPANALVGQQTLVERLGSDSRVAPAGDRLVVESPIDVTALIERTGHVELRDAEHQETVVDARTLKRIDADDHGVTIEGSAPLPFHVHSEVTFVLDGQIKLAATPDKVDGATMHVPMASLAQAQDLRAMLLAGAATGMHVASREPFSRAVGFWPRAWLFLAIAAACELVAAALLFVKRR